MNLDAWYYWDDSDIHDKGDDAVYQDALERVWVLGTAWGYSKYSEFANGTDLNVNATLTCLRAREGESGSDESGQDIQDDDSGASRSSQSSWGLVTLAAAIGVAVHMYY